MGAAASSAGGPEHVCYGYWDTSSNSIHMIRLNSTASQESSDSSIHDDDKQEEYNDDDDDNDDDVLTSTPPTKHQLASKGRKLSDAVVLPKRFKLRHTKTGGYKRLECSSVGEPRKETVERRLSSVKLQEMESVNMPLKAAKILVGNPMRIKMERELIDSDEDSEIPINASFDIVQVCSDKVKQNSSTLPHIKNTCSSLVAQQQSSSVLDEQNSAVLSTNDTVITMVLPRKAAKLLLGEGQVNNGTSNNSVGSSNKPPTKYTIAGKRT